MIEETEQETKDLMLKSIISLEKNFKELGLAEQIHQFLNK